MNIMELDNYDFLGLGENLFNKTSNFAINSKLKIIGDSLNTSKSYIKHKYLAWKISDLIIKSNYFNRKNLE